jgi:uncharacterized protein (TIGR01777 family)
VRIAITGSSGLIGSALVARFPDDGHAVTRVVRSTSVRDPRHRTVVWNPTSGVIDSAALEGHDAVVHLAGEDIAAGRWTPARKHVIRESRIHGTRLLSEALASLAQKPRVLITASGIGYYGNHEPNERVNDTSPRGNGFLADLVRDWEQATAPAKAAGIRVVHTRFGIVLSPRGGALAKMLPPFKMGIGGQVGSGQQVMSWIALDDVPSVMLHIIAQESISGPVNVVSPHPVTNAEFTRVLGKVLGRPTIFPLPSFAVRLLFGEMGEALLLGGAHIVPKRLEESGFHFAYPHMEHALRHLLRQ